MRRHAKHSTQRGDTRRRGVQRGASHFRSSRFPASATTRSRSPASTAKALTSTASAGTASAATTRHPGVRAPPPARRQRVVITRRGRVAISRGPRPGAKSRSEGGAGRPCLPTAGQHGRVGRGVGDLGRRAGAGPSRSAAALVEVGRQPAAAAARPPIDVAGRRRRPCAGSHSTADTSAAMENAMMAVSGLEASSAPPVRFSRGALGTREVDAIFRGDLSECYRVVLAGIGAPLDREPVLLHC